MPDSLTQSNCETIHTCCFQPLSGGACYTATELIQTGWFVEMECVPLITANGNHVNRGVTCNDMNGWPLLDWENKSKIKVNIDMTHLSKTCKKL